MSTMTYSAASNLAVAEEMRRDRRVWALGHTSSGVQTLGALTEANA